MIGRVLWDQSQLGNAFALANEGFGLRPAALHLAPCAAALCVAAERPVVPPALRLMTSEMDESAVEVQLAGHLLKMPTSGRTRKLVRRYFVLKDGFLLYYPERKKPSTAFDPHPKVGAQRCMNLERGPHGLAAGCDPAGWLHRGATGGRQGAPVQLCGVAPCVRHATARAVRRRRANAGRMGGGGPGLPTRVRGGGCAGHGRAAAYARACCCRLHSTYSNALTGASMIERLRDEGMQAKAQLELVAGACARWGRLLRGADRPSPHTERVEQREKALKAEQDRRRELEREVARLLRERSGAEEAAQRAADAAVSAANVRARRAAGKLRRLCDGRVCADAA